MKLKRFFKFCIFSVGALLVCIVVVNLTVYAGSKPYIYEKVGEVKEVRTALVLGAAVYKDGTLSPIFKKRAEKAVELYKAKKVEKVLVSGDNSSVAHNEVNPVREYLLTKDIPDSAIFLDHAGFDTYSTMYRARDIFKVDSVVIVTQAFHLPRSVFIARMLGLDAYGIPADDGSTKIKNYIREVLANEKAAMNLLFHRKPKFLGETIPITESGADSR